MTDKQIIRLIDKTMKEKGITLQDMIGGSYIDPEQRIDDPYGNPKTARPNIFTADSWSERFTELICGEAYSPYANYYMLKIPIKDLVRFWWNNCIDREEMLEDIFEDIFCYFKDKMLPKEEEVEIDISIKTDLLALPQDNLNVSNMS